MEAGVEASFRAPLKVPGEVKAGREQRSVNRQDSALETDVELRRERC